MVIFQTNLNFQCMYITHYHYIFAVTEPLLNVLKQFN